MTKKEDKKYIVLGRSDKSVFLCSPYSEGINVNEEMFTMVTPLSKDVAEDFLETLQENHKEVAYTVVEVE